MYAEFGRLKRFLLRFESQSLSHQILVLVITGIAFLAIFTSIAVSLLSERLAVQRAVQQGISISNALAKNSTLALVYASKDNAQDALNAALAFPGVIQVAISDLSTNRILKQHGDVADWMEDHFTLQPGGAVLEYQTDDYWQFGALVQVISGAPEGSVAPFELAQPSTETVGRVHLLISKNELRELMHTIWIGNVTISIFLCLILFVVLQLIIRRTTEPFTDLANMMQKAQQGEHGLRIAEKGSSELRHIGASFNKMMDVLEIRELELMEARDAALESSRLKSEFVANISHEIRTPMNGVLGMLNLLDEEMFSAEEKGYITVAKESGQTLLGLINSILDFSKLNAEQVKLKNTQINFPMLLENTLALHSGADKKNLIELGLIYDKSVPAILWGDATRLQQLINNLVSNAVKFTEKGEIRIEVMLQELNFPQVRVSIQVIDSGIGIPSEFCAKVFEPYSQQDGSISRRFGGTGLGLAICKRLVDLMGGDIGVSSVEGSGSCFTLNLPFKIATHETPVIFNARQYFEHLYLIASKGFCQNVLINVAQNWQIDYTCVDTAAHWRKDLNAAQLTQRLCVMINWSQPLDSLVRDLEQLKSAGNVYIVHFYNPLFDGQENTALVDLHLVKPIRRYELQERIASCFARKSEVMLQSMSKAIKQEHLNITVLVVEDNIVNQKVAKAHLHKLGLQCDLASNGQEAVEAVSKREYDLILMDCQMPVLDGYEATKKIRLLSSLMAKVPIIALSANTSSEDVERCTAVGMNGFIGKPFTRDQLTKELARWFPKIAEMIKLQKSA
jgi:signal transduction histidine kinase/CheY-like chemotaxis protein